MNNEDYMSLALEEAEKALLENEVPVGAVVVCGGKVVGHGRNRRENGKNALYHAEIQAIDEACKMLGGWRLQKCDMYVTLEPCPMCAGAIINARIKNLYYGAKDEKSGSAESVIRLFEYPYNHKVSVTGGVMEEECAAVLKDFFANLRAHKS